MNLITGDEPNQTATMTRVAKLGQEGRETAQDMILRAAAETDDDMRGIIILRGLQEATGRDVAYRTAYFHAVAQTMARSL